MKRLRWQLVIILLTGLVVGVLLLTQKAPAPGTTTNSGPEPVTGGMYTEGLVGSLQRLNPLLDMYNQVDRDVDQLLFSGLVRFDSNGVPLADLADWGVSHDGTIYNFQLKADALWHDGQPVTSDDVVFTYSLLKSQSKLIPADQQAFWKDIEIKKLDERNFQFRLPEAYAPFLDYLTSGILPRHLLSTQNLDQMVDARFNVQPVGSGPYRFDHLIVDNGKVVGVALTAFDRYYAKKPFIPQLTFRYYADSKAALQAYQGNEIQGIDRVSADIFDQVMAEPNLMTYTGRLPSLSLVLFNLKDKDLPFFQDANVRHALLQALNRQWIVDRILSGQAIVANGPLFPGTWAYYDGLPKTTFDLEAAAKTLKDAGYSLPADGEKVWTKDNVAISFSLAYPDQDPYKAIAESIQQNWNALGVKVSLEAIPYDQLISDRLNPRAYQAALVDLNLASSPDPDPYPFWDQEQSSGGQNYSQWNNRAVSEYLEQARMTTDMGQRALLYRNFQVIFNKELPALPLYYPVYTYAVDKQVQGVRMGPIYNPADRFNTLTEWFLLTKRGTSSAAPTATQP